MWKMATGAEVWQPIVHQEGHYLQNVPFSASLNLVHVLLQVWFSFYFVHIFQLPAFS
jgi:hypothetical protein